MKIKFIIALTLISLQITAQRPSTGLWLTAQLPIQLNNKWQVVNDFNYRTLGNSSAALQHLHRAGIKYIFNKNWSTTAGIAFIFTRTSFVKSNTEFAEEFRLWQEANYKATISSSLTGNLRLRIEERFFSATNTKASYNAFRYRIRPQLQQKLSSHWSLFVANEYMQQYVKNKWSYDQNRFIVNGIYAFKNKAQLNAGYLWLRWPANSSQHILTIGFQKTISVHGK